MKTPQLLYVGIKGSVIALDRNNGQMAWVMPLKGTEFVNVLFENGRLFATCRGEVYCLDPQSGRILWNNPLKGYGYGLATLALPGKSNGSDIPMAERSRRDAETASAAAIGAVGVNA